MRLAVRIRAAFWYIRFLTGDHRWKGTENREGFYGAVGAGADAVYLGGSRFGARAYAENFTTEEVVECIKYAHLMGVKVYLTVNTLVKETELQDLEDYLAPFHEAGLDAVIVQDLGVLVSAVPMGPGC